MVSLTRITVPFSSTDKSKLDGIEDGATANDTDANLLARENHTGSQAISTVTGLQTALDGKATAAQGALADTAIQPGNAALADSREWTAETVSQVEAEAGTATTRRAWTAQRVFQAVAAWWAASSAKTKLDGIEAGADVTDTANVTAAGALMDSECTNLGAVKGLDQGVDSISNPSFATLGLGGSLTGGVLDVLQSAAGALGVWIRCSSASYANGALVVSISTAASTAFNFFAFYSSGGDLEARMQGNGNLRIDGAVTGGGADYGEWFEAISALAARIEGGLDIRGRSVVLAGEKFRLATSGDDPEYIVGVVSANPSVVGDGDMDRWKGKYLRDDFGAYVWEDYEADGAVQQRRKINPDYDPDRPYTPRAGRSEWAIIGLMGKLRLRKGQPVGTRWIKMRDVSATVEEWLVR